MSQEQNAHAIDPQALREIVEGTSAETGAGFFDALVKHLARSIGTKCAWVTEWLPDQRRLRALSFWNGENYTPDYEYPIADTPCESVVESRRPVIIHDRLIDLYPKDPDLPHLGAMSYMGVPLFDTDGQIMGHLAVLDDKPTSENESVTAIFNIFAGRASAELRRLRRDRALHEREQKLSLMFEGAMDAIIEFDSDFRITNLNAAAIRVFGGSVSDRLDKGLDELVTKESQGKLIYLIGELGRKNDGKQSSWIPDGLEGVDPEGKRFPAEATLSRYELAGRSFYTLILRNVHERVAAEERIRSLMGEADYLRAEIDAIQGFEEIVGASPALRHVLKDVERVAGMETTVLITGETGTGKELIARAIHRRSERRAKPLITVNCAAISSNLQESEFFGHEKGAFTGAVQRRDGRFKLADGGTIFLDEVGEMSLDLQAKLLRVLQEGEFEPVGSSRTVRVNVRVVAATNRDLEQMSKEGLFRADLMYRLNVFPVHLPSLRERGEDVVLLAEMFARQLGKRRGLTVATLSEAQKSRLRRYDWPGNIRELQNVIERAFITSLDGKTLNLDRALPDIESTSISVPRADSGESRVLTAKELKDLERKNIETALVTAKGRVSGPGGAAELLGLNANTLASRMRVLGIAKSKS
ncbi:MAG TPA: sigma 54-interacting transcriptional regulator [Blastocatellia bacterium]|nr:sigma 54-interacting transcriptional regulator [Blastocatellia bacterium]